MRTKFLTSLAASVLVAACQQQSADIPADRSSSTSTVVATDSETDAATSHPGLPTETSMASLEPEIMMLGEWREAKLTGELGCGFRRESADGPLLFAVSFVDKAATSDAAIKLGGKIVKLTTETKGGFDALSSGARFVGPDGLFANVVRGGDRIRETPQIAEESPLFPAQLVISQDSRDMAVDGLWECGP